MHPERTHNACSRILLKKTREENVLHGSATFENKTRNRKYEIVITLFLKAKIKILCCTLIPKRCCISTLPIILMLITII